jgi:septal ring factor EnvC (AmiA/AmiB activator)
MRRLLLAAPVLMGCLGCLSPVTDRLDHINEQLAVTNQRLDDINQKLDQTNQRLDNVNQKLDETNRRLAQLDKRLARLTGERSAATQPMPTTPVSNP